MQPVNILKDKATAAFVSLSNRNSKDMNKASWLPAHVYGNGYVGIGSNSILFMGHCGNLRDFAVIYPIPTLSVAFSLARLMAYDMFIANQQQNVNMNYTDEEALCFINRLLEWLHQSGENNQGSPSQLVFVAPGAQYVNQIGTQIFGTEKSLKSKPDHSLINEPTQLPAPLATDEATILWQKAQEAGYVDEHCQPKVSRTKAALLADAIAMRLGIKEKWKVFENLWNRKNMYNDYYNAMNQQQSLKFQDQLKQLFG